MNQEEVGSIQTGYLLLVGFEREDHPGLLKPMINKIRQIRLFPDTNGRFALSLEDISGSLLMVSQFTLSAELKKGRKPSFSKAMEPEMAESLYNEFIQFAKETDTPVETGIFGALMQITLQNDGPVTILLDSRQLFPSLHH